MLRALILLPLLALPAIGQEEDRFAFEGSFGASVLDDETVPFVGGTATIDITPRVALELGAFGEPMALRHETYAVLTWSGAGGRISGGIPRPAYDLYGISLLDRVLPPAGAFPSQVAATRSSVTAEAVEKGHHQAGLLYRSDSGWAISAHQIFETSVSTGSVGGGLIVGGWTVEGALDLASDGRRGAKLTAAREFGHVRAQVGGYKAPADDLDDMLEAGLTWNATRSLAVSALTQVHMGDGDNDLAAVAAVWDTSRGTVHLGLVSDDGTPAASVAFGLRF